MWTSTGEQAEARKLPKDMVPLIGPGFKPTERDEMGLWKEMERAEEETAHPYPQSQHNSLDHHTYKPTQEGQKYPSAPHS